MGCFKCGISEDNVRLFDAISSKGIVKICSKCSSDEDMPIIRKPTIFQLKESERKQGIYEKLSKASEVNQEKKENKVLLEKQDTTLREIVDRNYQERVEKEVKPRPDLIENFHWVIMRARRSKKLTQKQLAKEIQESETAIKMSEKGILPEDDNRLVNKIESYLGVNITKKIKPKPEQIQIKEISLEETKEVREPTDLAFDPLSVRNLTIDDVKSRNKKREM
ncbi:MAG TPA: hypothetical protein ENG87_00125, partial [Candidatus Pacearchaeota archaeon]|nr:hypothetical protein [Candidatus Pacearchaeota archaeon]